MATPTIKELQDQVKHCQETIAEQRQKIQVLNSDVSTLKSAKNELKETLFEYHTSLCIAEGYIQRVNQMDTASFRQGIPNYPERLTLEPCDMPPQPIHTPFEAPKNPYRTQLHVMDDIFGEKPRRWMDL